MSPGVSFTCDLGSSSPSLCSSQGHSLPTVPRRPPPNFQQPRNFLRPAWPGVESGSRRTHAKLGSATFSCKGPYVHLSRSHRLSQPSKGLCPCCRSTAVDGIEDGTGLRSNSTLFMEASCQADGPANGCG